MSEQRSDTGPQRVVLLRNGPSTPSDTQAVDIRGDLARLVEETLARRGLPTGSAQALGQDAEQLITQAARKVPSWVSLAFVVFGVPSVGSFLATAQSVWGLPDRVAQIERELEAQRKIHEAQGRQLDEVLTLLRGTRSSSQPSKP
jgi:hypothetical protein